ncbi:MAG: hypothetical protein J6X76_04015 [Bacteroidaceae bacterium]|nr:hypothetical protein [Bacteroidaceae bacterium]
MKKTYIAPSCVVMALNAENIMCMSSYSAESRTYEQDTYQSLNGGDGFAREIISDETTIIARSAWERW